MTAVCHDTEARVMCLLAALPPPSSSCLCPLPHTLWSVEPVQRGAWHSLRVLTYSKTEQRHVLQHLSAQRPGVKLPSGLIAPGTRRGGGSGLALPPWSSSAAPLPGALLTTWRVRVGPWGHL